jgi:hypothetical protein
LPADELDTAGGNFIEIHLFSFLADTCAGHLVEKLRVTQIAGTSAVTRLLISA